MVAALERATAFGRWRAADVRSIVAAGTPARQSFTPSCRITRSGRTDAIRGAQASLAKYTATRTARVIASEARDLLGGNGILLRHRVVRHFADIEAIHTYEGTETVQALIVGRDITGVSAFA